LLVNIDMRLKNQGHRRWSSAPLKELQRALKERTIDFVAICGNTVRVQLSDVLSGYVLTRKRGQDLKNPKEVVIF
jgi:aspartate/glutamate racemase